MFHIFNFRTRRAALGAALLILVAGCSDVPSGLRQPLPGPLDDDHAVAAPADRPLVELPALRPRSGERRQRRSLRGADGQVLVVESVLGADGRPRESMITRNGLFLMRISNEWAPGATRRLDRQQVLVRGADGHLRALDSRSVSPAQLAAAHEKLRAEAEQMSRSQSGRIRRLEGDFGVCDAEVKAANIATWQYVATAAAVALSASTGNWVQTATLYMAYLASYANYESKQADLDKCVDRAGKKPELDEY
ncbi:MAG: hypothetical protein AABZ29_04290 [Gemmatimonadota bacterium]